MVDLDQNWKFMGSRQAWTIILEVRIHYYYDPMKLRVKYTYISSASIRWRYSLEYLKLGYLVIHWVFGYSDTRWLL